MSTGSSRKPLTEAFYEWIADEEDSRICKDISDQACHEVPGNFFRIFAANTLSKLGDQLSSPKSTLPWLLQTVGGPIHLTALLTPIRESGSLLPQIWIGGAIRRLAMRKWVWVGGSLAQATAIAAMGLVAAFMTGASAGWAIIALLVLFSLARGFCSIAFKDVMGKTIPRTRRGLLNGLMGSAAGAIAALAALVFVFNPEWESTALYGVLLACAAGLWILGAASLATVREFPGATDGGESGWEAAWQRVRLLSEDGRFRKFVTARSLALGTSLAAPFYVALAQAELGSSFRYLGYFILAEGIAGFLSATIWGKWSDRSSRQVMATACALAGVVNMAVIVYAATGAAAAISPAVFYPLAFFALGIAHAGVRTGRKTHLIDMASGNRRTDYVAVSNSFIGIMLLALGVVLAAIASMSVLAAIILLASLCAAASITSWRLEEAQ